MENHSLPQADSSVAPPIPPPDRPILEGPQLMGAITQTYGASIFFLRWGAHVIDYILLIFFVLGIGALAGRSSNDLAIIGLLVFVLGILSYYVLLEGFTGYTIGKFALRIKVVNQEGQPPGLWKSVIRSLIRIVETNPMLIGGLPAGISVLVSKKKQRFGDMAANTFVVKVKDLKNESKQLTTSFAIGFSLLALVIVACGIYGVSFYAKQDSLTGSFENKAFFNKALFANFVAIAVVETCVL